MSETIPWYKRTLRWGQTNLTEIDPARYDSEWWQQHWQKTDIQGIIVNAGGIIFYYPSQFKNYKARFLEGQDLLGKIIADARAANLSVLARMDINRIDEEAMIENPEWVTRKANGIPYQVGDRYFTCINSSYYTDYIPQIFAEIVERYQPDGFTDNSWTGLTRNKICYCENCQKKYRQAYRSELPEKVDWQNENYKAWIRWNYDLRVKLWQHFNRETQKLGGEDCLWLGMTRGEIIDQCEGFRDFYRLSKEAGIIMFDSQRREQESGFQTNAEMGKLLHELAGWDVLIPESMAFYQASYKGQPTFRHSSKPEPEVRMWALSGFAGGIQPWWHHISAQSEDARQYSNTSDIFNWHARHQQYLTNREPLAQIALLWSQDNFDFYGQDQLHDKILLPWQGWREAMIRGGILYRVVHIDELVRLDDGIKTLILPNLAALSRAQVEAINNFARKGGNIIATGETSLYNENGHLQDNFQLAELLGIDYKNNSSGSITPDSGDWDNWQHHSYLRIYPSFDETVYSPGDGYESQGERHQLLRGFKSTNILPFGGKLEHVQEKSSTEVLLRQIPTFPIYPPETSWMREPEGVQPALTLNHTAEGGKVVYMAADIDRCFGRYGLPDHGKLLQNCLNFTLEDEKHFSIKVNGVLDCHLYRQEEHLVLHLINLSGEGFRKPPLHQLLPVHDVQLSLNSNLLSEVKQVKSLVSDGNLSWNQQKENFIITINRITDHEVLVMS